MSGHQTNEPRPPARRLPPWLLRLTAAAALLGAVGATTVYALERAGVAPYDEPFVRYNGNRIAAAADRAFDRPDSLLVAALGTSRLRMATLDEADMAALAAAEGLPPFHFLRITNDAAAFRDFEPLLDRILAAGPDVVLIDLDLLFRERRPLAFIRERARGLADRLIGEHPFSLDQVRLQYAKACAAPPAGGLEAHVAEQERRFTLDPASPAYARVHAFAERAAAAGAKVVLLEMRRPPAVEARRFAGAPYPPEALARVAADPVFDLWRFPRRLHDPASYCDHQHLGPDARTAYSAWLVAGIAASAGGARVEAVSMR